MNNDETLLRIEKVSKEFNSVIALEDVDFKLQYGEVHAICGENGAGKSTFCNIITGILKQDSGKVFYKNKEINFSHPYEALNCGIRMVYQERNLIPYLTGAQNILLREEPLTRGFIINENEINNRAEKLKKRYNITVPLNCPVSQLSAAKKQAIEILRSLLYTPDILILDEPTSSLTETESDALFSVIKGLKNEGVSIILITHKMEEVFQNADTISIFRNGKKITTEKREDISETECIRLMVNKKISSIYPPVVDSAKDVVMDVKKFSDYTLVNNNSFYLRRGEVLGFYGLIGSGRTELIELIYGLRTMKNGSVSVNGKEINPDPKGMIDENVFLVPDDRREKGLISRYNIKENMTISFIDKFIKYFGFISRRKEQSKAEEIVQNEVLKIKFPSLESEISSLSGGNQQKVVISRWISQENINVLILDEPTIGIDVGTKSEIYKMIRKLAEKKNIGIIFISSEMPELTGICDRLLVFKEGNIKAEFKREEFNAEKILSVAI